MAKWDLFEVDDDDDCRIEEYHSTYGTLLEAVIVKRTVEKYNDREFIIKVRYDE